MPTRVVFIGDVELVIEGEPTEVASLLQNRRDLVQLQLSVADGADGKPVWVNAAQVLYLTEGTLATAPSGPTV